MIGFLINVFQFRLTCRWRPIPLQERRALRQGIRARLRVKNSGENMATDRNARDE